MKRRHLLSALGTIVALSGCLRAPDGRQPTDGTTTPTTEPTGTPPLTRSTGTPSSTGAGTTSPTATTEPPSHESAANEPDPDVPIYVENSHSESHSVSLVVRREGGAVVYETTLDVHPGADREVYNLQEANPDGVERFTVEATLGTRRESVTVETSACYGSVVVAITEEGTLYPFYSVC